MLPVIAGAVALVLLSKRGREPNPNQLVVELDTALPQADVQQILQAIRMSTPETAGQLDAMASSYRQRGMPLAAYELVRRSWDVRGRQGPPPAPPSPNAGLPAGASAGPPVGCLDAASDPAMCQAIQGALLTETNPDKLHAFAETLRDKFPQAAAALDSKAHVFTGQPVARSGAPPAEQQPWTQVSSDMGNVPPQYHGALVAMMQQLGHDDSMAPGSERAVAVGDRMFVFVKPPPGPGVPPAAVWVTRMAVTEAQASGYATGYGSGPLWPVDIGHRGMIPPDRRIMGSPTIYDPSTEILSPPPAVQSVLMQGPPVQAVETIYVGGGDLASAVASMPQGAAFEGVPGIMGASRPDIVNAQEAAMQEHADAMAAHDQATYQMQVQQHMAMEQAAAVQAAAQQEVAASAPPPDRRASERPRPSVYVKIRHSDSVFPVKIAKIGSGNKNNFDQLVAMNPHLVSPSGAWRQMFPGDEVCIPPEWAERLRQRGFLIMSDYEGS
jgi:hypothetical protein